MSFVPVSFFRRYDLSRGNRGRNEDPELMIRVINNYLPNLHVYDHGTSTSQTDRQTDGRLTIAIMHTVRRSVKMTVLSVRSGYTSLSFSLPL